MSRASARSEAGSSLIETIMAVAVLGIAIVVIVGAMGTSMFASDSHRKQADANAILVTAAEAVKSTAFVKCASPLPSPPPGQTYAPGYLVAARAVPRPSVPGPVWTDGEITITEIKYWDGAAFGSTCYHSDAQAIPLALQLVTLQVSKSDGRASATVSVVKGP